MEKQAKTIDIGAKILSKNDKEAAKLKDFFKKQGIFVINLMSSPGSGKTTLLQTLAKNPLMPKFCVIEGDLQTNRDAKRLQDCGVEAYQISTGDACHLEAAMVKEALQHLTLKDCQFLFIENVGNLVCPASYDLGANLNIVLLSTPEGDDKVLKYPTMFLCADCVLISKIDLKDFFDFKITQVKKDLEQLKKSIPLFEISNKENDLIHHFIKFLLEKKEQNYVSSHSF